jgi:hypothetical protein
VRHKYHQSTSEATRTYTGWRNARLVREWHSTWLSQRPSQATVDDMRGRLAARAHDIRAKLPPPGKEPKPWTSSDLARLEKIARWGALRMRYRQFLSMFRL